MEVTNFRSNLSIFSESCLPLLDISEDVIMQNPFFAGKFCFFQHGVVSSVICADLLYFGVTQLAVERSWPNRNWLLTSMLLSKSLDNSVATNW